MSDETKDVAAASASEAAPGQATTEKVRGVFSKIAPTYDLLNRLISFGADEGWRRRTVAMAELTPDSRVLDLAAGTGDLTLALARRGHPAEVLSTDFVPEMLEIARPKAARYVGSTRIAFQVEDAQALTLPAGSFDVVTIAFGVRNLPDRAANFREVLRVLRPGGRYLILEFTTPPFAPFRWVYHWYIRTFIPFVGGLVSGERAAYQYLNDSIRLFPPQAALAEELRDAGFRDVSWRNMTFGVVAVHLAVKQGPTRV
jgi:demethylmenaquinone methyltransferase/2-methoxy-6-polyprenyl-1,4-benzoquinol methylase